MSERTINVKVQKDDDSDLDKNQEIARLTELLEDRNQLIESIATEEFENKINQLAEKHPQHSQRIRNIESPSQLAFVEAFLANEPQKKASSGSVSLRQPNTDITDPMNEEFPDAQSLVSYIYKHAYDVNSPFHNQMRTVKDQLWEKMKKLNISEVEFPTSNDEAEAIKALGRKFTWRDYTKWIQERARRQQK